MARRWATSQSYLEERARDPEDARLVNRIDRETSGLCLGGPGGEARRKLNMALERRDVEETYPRPVSRWPRAGPCGHWRNPVGRGLRGLRQSAWCGRMAEPAITEYVVESTRGVNSLCAVTLHTGRQHQIRLHASHNGFPLVGDWVCSASLRRLARAERYTPTASLSSTRTTASAKSSSNHHCPRPLAPFGPPPIRVTSPFPATSTRRKKAA